MTPLALSPFAHRLLTTLVFLLIPLSIFAPKGIVWEIIIAGLMSVYYSRKNALAVFPLSLTVVLVMMPLWGLVTTIWSNEPIPSLLMSLRILALVLLGIFWCRLMMSMRQEDKRTLIQALVAGLVLGLMLLMIEFSLGSPWRYFLNKPLEKAYSQGSLMISLIVWPVMLWILQQTLPMFWRISLGVGLLSCVFWILFQIDCDASLVGFFLGMGAFSSALLLPRLTSWGMRLLIPLFIASFPFISLYAFKPEYIPTYNSYIYSASYIDRLYIWNEVALEISEHPWRGIGMDGTSHHEKAKQIRDWTYVDETGKIKKNQSAYFPMHPHNAILQLWLELGFVGLILGTLLAYLSLFQIFRTNLVTIEKATCAGLFVGTFVIVWVSLGFWQNWWISGLWMIIGLTISLLKDKKEANEGIYNQVI